LLQAYCPGGADIDLSRDVVVVGAGLAGLAAARRLKALGRESPGAAELDARTLDTWLREDARGEKLEDRLARSGKAKAKVEAVATDQFDNQAVEEIKVKLRD